jgi:hypothetical protein
MRNCTEVLLGSGSPHLRALPKVIFGKSACPIDMDDDPRFSRTFWVEGTDRKGIRRYLGPELRHFFLAHGAPWLFHAGPEGVALVCRGRVPRKEAARIRAALKRLATLTESGT